jgi:hypothetical protein
MGLEEIKKLLHDKRNGLNWRSHSQNERKSLLVYIK